MARRRGTRHWRIGLALLGASAGLACQNGYPIAATQCDVWCEQWRRVDCAADAPAACVVECERAGLGRERCAAFVTQAVECLRGKTDQELDCATSTFTSQSPCWNEQAAALQCASAGGPGSQGTE